MDGPPGDEKDRIKDMVRGMKILWTAFISDFVIQRRTEEARRSLHFHFPNQYGNRRCVEYIKLDSGNKLMREERF